MPAGSVNANFQLRGKCPFGDLAIERRARQTGASKHCLETDDSFGSGHGDYLQLLAVDDAPCEEGSLIETRLSSASSRQFGAIAAQDAKTGAREQYRLSGDLRRGKARKGKLRVEPRRFAPGTQTDDRFAACVCMSSANLLSGGLPAMRSLPHLVRRGQ